MKITYRGREVKSDDALVRLQSLLSEAGVDVERPSADDVRLTWSVFRQFGSEPVEDCEPAEQDGDLLLAQFGTFNWGEGEHFELDLTRQFSFVDENGECDHMAQLNCTFLFEPTDELREAGSGSEWSGSTPLDEFFQKATALPGFRVVTERQLSPIRLQIGYDDVC